MDLEETVNYMVSTEFFHMESYFVLFRSILESFKYNITFELQKNLDGRKI